MKLSKSQLILGGQKSGKSRHAELIAASWLTQEKNASALLIATAKAFDQEMQQRISRHQAGRLLSVPKMALAEEPICISKIIREQSSSSNLIVVDCLTVWLTNLLMPHPQLKFERDIDPEQAIGDLIDAISYALGPIILISNEIGLGVIPMGSETRAYVDALGRLNQRIAKACDTVTMMVAGIPWDIKGAL